MTLRTWDTLVGPVTVPTGGVHLLIDPDGLEDVADALVVSDRWQLRRLLELEVADRTSRTPPLLLHLKLPDVRTLQDLPFDARSYPCHIVDLRAPAGVGQEAAKLPRPVLKALLEGGTWRERAARAAHLITGLAWPAGAEHQVIAALRLAELGPGLRSAVATTLPPGWLRQTLLSSDPVDVVAQEVRQWCEQGAHDRLDGALRLAQDDLARLVSTGVIEPPRALVSPMIPSDLRDAVVQRQDHDSLVQLIEALDEVPTSLDAWYRLADRWAATRRLLSRLSQDEADEWGALAWPRWQGIDERWTTWLQASYGQLLSRSPANPVGVHHVAPFLARRGVGPERKIVLLVLDGLGLSQWQILQQELALEVLEERRVLASLPTLTSISRQAIFAGALPTTFADSARVTTHEGNHWEKFWMGHQLRPDQIHYAKSSGQTAAEWTPPPLGACISGFAVSAPDKLLHGANVLGDRQLSVGITQWAQAGYLSAVQAWCRAEGAELWITSDHGNLPTTANTSVTKNLTVQRVGHRVAFHSREVFRDQITQPGLAWTPPGLGQAADTIGLPYFAPGRTAFTSTPRIVAHGGLSIDEVVVPLVRIV